MKRITTSFVIAIMFLAVANHCQAQSIRAHDDLFEKLTEENVIEICDAAMKDPSNMFSSIAEMEDVLKKIAGNRYNLVEPAPLGAFAANMLLLFTEDALICSTTGSAKQEHMKNIAAHKRNIAVFLGVMAEFPDAINKTENILAFQRSYWKANRGKGNFADSRCMKLLNLPKNK